MRDTLYRFHGRVKPQRRSVLNEVPLDAGDANTTVLRLHDPIDSWGGEWGVSSKEFHEALDAVQTDNIRLHINSPGGEVFEAVAILNALRRHPARVTAVVDSLAASAASFLAVGADETIMAPNSQLMIHDAWGISIGNAKDMRETADILDHLSDNIASIYAEKSGASVEAMRLSMQAETWFSADEAVTAGLANGIEQTAVAVKNNFDLSVFQHAGREDAPTPLIMEPPAEATSTTTEYGEDGTLFEMRHRLNLRRAKALNLPR